MIFVTLGSQKFQFNRLLKELDKLKQQGKIKEKIFAQKGYSDYEPKNYEYKDFLDREEFKQKMKESEIIISHGGTGALITGIKQEKKVIGIPRLEKYGEHVDDHQMQIVKEFEENKLIKAVYEIEELEEAIEKIKTEELKKYVSNTEKIIKSIEEYIEGSENK